MQNEIRNINNYTLILDNYKLKQDKSIETSIKKSSIGFVFYGSGDFLIDVQANNKNFREPKRTGVISSFYCNENVKITQHISKNKPIKKVSVFIDPEKLHSLINEEEIIYQKHFNSLLNSQNDYVKGSKFLVTPRIQTTIDNVLFNSYTGLIQKIFLESQIIELLLSYFKSVNSYTQNQKTQNKDVDKLHYARELLLSHIDTPPSLDKLSKLTGLNNYKLKTGFKELFGLPVYKYLQNKRLEKAYELLENKEFTVQETAWYVGYESLGSFSNAFYKKFGYRPSEINK